MAVPCANSLIAWINFMRRCHVLHQTGGELSIHLIWQRRPCNSIPTQLLKSGNAVIQMNMNSLSNEKCQRCECNSNLLIIERCFQINYSILVILKLKMQIGNAVTDYSGEMATLYY